MAEDKNPNSILPAGFRSRSRHASLKNDPENTYKQEAFKTIDNTQKSDRAVKKIELEQHGRPQNPDVDPTPDPSGGKASQ